MWKLCFTDSRRQIKLIPINAKSENNSGNQSSITETGPEQRYHCVSTKDHRVCSMESNSWTGKQGLSISSQSLIMDNQVEPLSNVTGR